MYHLAEGSLGQSKATGIKWLTNITCVLINGLILVSSVIEGSNIIGDYFEINKIIVKIFIVVIFLFVTLVCLEPEKIKPLGYISCITVLSIGILNFIKPFYCILITFFKFYLKIKDQTLLLILLAGKKQEFL